jgi:hypothetical protein
MQIYEVKGAAGLTHTPGVVPCAFVRLARTIYLHIGLARTIYIRCMYGVLGRNINKYTVIYGSGEPYLYTVNIP